MVLQSYILTACLFTLALGRMEMQPVTPLPDDYLTKLPFLKGKNFPRFAGMTDPWCPDGWDLFGQTSSCFRKAQLYDTLEHTSAQEFCRQEGGSLATVTEKELQGILRAHSMQARNPRNTTVVWWMGYILVPATSGSHMEGNSSGNNDSSTNTTMWQVRTEEPTGPEPLIDNSANIPTTVPDDLKSQPVVCVQLKLVYVSGYLTKWGWNLARCDESIPFICKKGASKSCFDRKGDLIPEGKSFTPPGHDSCTVCTCLHGVPNICSIAGCAPPKCMNFERNPDECCQYKCLDHDPNNLDNEKPEALMSENMRWVLTMITSFLLLGMMLFMVYRMRQKRIAYLRYRVQQLRDGNEGDFEPGSGPPPVPALDDIGGAIFREPPPPYSFFKDNNTVEEMPPPYMLQQGTLQRNSRRETNQNRDSRASNQPDHVMLLLPGSEPTTPSDISTISTATSPPPYNRCLSAESNPLTPVETTPILSEYPVTTTQSTLPMSSITSSSRPSTSSAPWSSPSSRPHRSQSPSQPPDLLPPSSPPTIRNTTV